MKYDLVLNFPSYDLYIKGKLHEVDESVGINDWFEIDDIRIEGNLYKLLEWTEFREAIAELEELCLKQIKEK